MASSRESMHHQDAREGSPVRRHEEVGGDIPAGWAAVSDRDSLHAPDVPGATLVEAQVERLLGVDRKQGHRLLRRDRLHR